MSFQSVVFPLSLSLDDAYALKSGKIYVIRFYEDFETMQSKYQQQGHSCSNVGTESRDAQLQVAFNHMYSGNTSDSPFISFTSNPNSFLKTVSSNDCSLVVRSIVKGSDGHVGPPRQAVKHYGIFELDRDRSFTSQEIKQFSNATKQEENPDQDHYFREKEIVYYALSEVVQPIKDFNNPYFKS